MSLVETKTRRALLQLEVTQAGGSLLLLTRFASTAGASLSYTFSCPQKAYEITNMFSPSPFPPGGGRRTRNITPNRRSHLPGGNRASSRLTTPGVRVVSDSRMSVEDASVASDGASEMSVDAGTAVQRSGRHKPGVVFAQSEELRVSLLAHLPSEVLQVLRSASE